MIQDIALKIQNWEQIAITAANWKSVGERIVFTNGCFDILHYGHLHYLTEAKSLGDRLVVGINSSDSVSKLKGKHRPINDDLTRFYMLAALVCVDAVVVFEEDTPYELIKVVEPNVLVKGGDWQPHQIVGSDIVLGNGGVVKSLAFVDGYSTTTIETKILNMR